MEHPLVHTVNKIMQAKESGVFCMIKSEHDVQNLKLLYPKLYGMITSNNCDKDVLTKMLKLVHRVHEGSLEQSKADEQFGKVAVDKFVAPLLKK